METMRTPGTRTTLAAVLFAGCFLAAARRMDAQSTTYSGQAVAVSVNVIGIPISISNTGPLPSNGGALFDQLASLTVPGVANVQLLTASTNGEDGLTNSQASVAEAAIRAAGISITASVLTATANAACTANGVSANGNSQIADLRVNGLSVRVTGQPNQVIPLLVGSLIINEQIRQESDSGAEMIVNALHLRVLGLADVIISGTQAGVQCALPPPPQ